MKTTSLTTDEILTIINETEGVLLYFSTRQCNVCDALKPKVKEEFEKNFPKIRQLFIDASENPQIAAHFQIFSAPAILVFLDKKEFARESRNVSLSLLVKKLARPYALMSGD